MLNKPEDYKWTQEDILREYEELHIEKSVARKYCITIKEVKKILKNNERKSS
mgnify:FL=1